MKRMRRLPGLALLLLLAGLLLVLALPVVAAYPTTPAARDPFWGQVSCSYRC